MADKPTRHAPERDLYPNARIRGKRPTVLLEELIVGNGARHRSLLLFIHEREPALSHEHERGSSVGAYFLY